MNLWLIEPYYTGSHQAWYDDWNGLVARLRHALLQATETRAFSL
jgi:hypothetical protein